MWSWTRPNSRQGYCWMVYAWLQSGNQPEREDARRSGSANERVENGNQPPLCLNPRKLGSPLRRTIPETSCHVPSSNPCFCLDSMQSLCAHSLLAKARKGLPQRAAGCPYQATIWRCHLQNQEESCRNGARINEKACHNHQVARSADAKTDECDHGPAQSRRSSREWKWNCVSSRQLTSAILLSRSLW